MEESRNQKVLDLERQIKMYASQKKDILDEITVLLKEKDQLQNIYNDSGRTKEEYDDIASKIEGVQSKLDNKEHVLQKKMTLIDNLEREKNELLETNSEKIKQVVWEKYQTLKPTVDALKEKANNTFNNAKEDMSKTFSKENVKEKLEEIKETDGMKKVSERASIVKEELSELNLYKILGQLKRNTSDALEDIEAYVKNNNIDKKVKTKVDKYVTPELKGSISQIFHKIKTGINEASEVIMNNSEEETEAKKKESVRKFKVLKENYLKSWVRENEIKVNNSTRSSIKLIHENYINFMLTEYGQENNSKLIILDYNEFVNTLSKYLSQPIIFNIDTGEVNLVIK